jgi:hypothetical protein
MSDDVQVTLDGSEAKRLVAVDRADVEHARRLAYLAAEAASDGDLDAHPEPFADLGMRLAKALERDDLETDDVIEFGGEADD